MYHSSSFLRRILCKEGILVEEDMLFDSCECNASKYRGDLYEYVRQQVGKKHWIHYGDNKYSDIRMAFRHVLIPKRVVSNIFPHGEVIGSMVLRALKHCGVIVKIYLIFTI